MGNVMVIPAKRQVGNTVKQSEQKKLRVAAYCRVSTDSDEQETSYEAQVTHYTNFIQAHDGWELAGIFADDGISGTGTITPAIKYCHFRWCPHPVPDTEPAWGDRNMI